MKKLDAKIYVVMFSLTMIFLFLSGAQREFKIFKTKPLSGAIEIPQVAKFNFKNCYDATYQKSLEEKLEVSFGFREPLIRLYNQYVWDFYGKKYSRQVLVGKENWLFPYWHLLAPKYSKELTDRFDKQALYIHQLSGVLKEYNTQILVGFIPSKLDIYEEYVTSAISKKDDFNPIDYFCNKFDDYGVNYINFTEMFYAMKDTAIFNPFTPSSAHWSNIASVYATDSIFKRFEELSGINMPKLKIGTPYIDKTRTPDNDLELLYNLCRTIHPQTDYYVDVEMIKDSTTTHPMMITIGDSHFWTVSYNIPLRKIFSRCPYWYYASSIYFDKKYKNVEQADKVKEFIEADYILMLYSANQAYNMNTDLLAWTLIQLCVDKEEIDMAIDNVVETIKSNSEWKNNVEKKAVQQGRSFEEMVYIEARYVIRENPYKYFPQLNETGVPSSRSKKLLSILNNDETIEDRVAEIISSMHNNKEWMNSLKEKAKKNGKTLEEVMHGDALWIIKQEDEKKKVEQ